MSLTPQNTEAAKFYSAASVCKGIVITFFPRALLFIVFIKTSQLFLFLTILYIFIWTRY